MAGGYEFHRPNHTNLSRTKTKKLVKVYSELDYDLGIISPQVTDLLTDSEKEQVSDWRETTNSVQTRILDYQDHKLGILIFPELNKNSNGKTKGIHKEIVKKARELRPRVNLLIGISPWGNFPEDKFLTNNPPVLDILLGSGSGPHMTGKFLQDKKTVWVRPLSKGKTISQITIPCWPKKNTNHVWKPNKNITTNLILLKGDIPADPKISSYLQ